MERSRKLGEMPERLEADPEQHLISAEPAAHNRDAAALRPEAPIWI